MLFYLIWLFICLLLIIIIFHIIYAPKSKTPPGPVFSIIPYFIYKSILLKKRLNQKMMFQELKKDYGEISQFQIGDQRFILLSSFDVIYEAYVKNKVTFNSRPQAAGYDILTNNFKGLMFSEGNIWKRNRTITVKSLHSLGVGRKEFNELSVVNIEGICEWISNNQSKEVDICPILFRTFFNVMNSLIFGNNSEETESKSCEIYETICFLAQNDFSFCQLYWKYRSYTVIRKLFPILEMYVNNISKLQEYIKLKVKCKLRDLSEDANDECLLKFYRDENMEYDEIIQCCVDLYFGGIDTVSSFVSSCLLLLSKYQHFQQKIKLEIESLKNTVFPITYEHKRFLPFTQAFIEECHRYFILIPIIQHRVIEEIILRGYLIKPTDIILASQYSINDDSTIWDNPNEFNPYRFIKKEDGTFQPNATLIPFGIGGRTCFGEVIGRTEIFNSIVAIIGQFNVTLSTKTKENFERIFDGNSGGILHAPLAHTLIFTECLEKY